MTLSPSSFRKRYTSSYETPSPSSSLVPSMTLPSWNRYRGTSEPIKDNKVEDTKSETEREESEDKDPGSEIQQIVDETVTRRLPVHTTWEDFIDASLTVPSPVAIPASIEQVDKGFLAELGAEIELHGGAEGLRSRTREEDGPSRGVG
ncbi:hypothetical protein Tco_0872570 [Tanacetum coccineum]